MSEPGTTFEQLRDQLTSRRTLAGRLAVLVRNWRRVQDLSGDERKLLAGAIAGQIAERRLERLYSGAPLSREEKAARTVLERMGVGTLEEAQDLLRADQDAEDTEGVEVTELPEPAVESELTPASPADPSFEPTEEDQLGAEEAEEIDVQVALQPAEPKETPPAAAQFATVAAPVVPEEPSGVLSEASAEPDPTEPAETTPSPDTEERRRRVTDAGSGWQARRLLSAMIRDRSLESLDEALDLISTLQPTQRSWCLGDLIAHWPLDPTSLERVASQAPSPAISRRLRERRPGVV